MLIPELITRAVAGTLRFDFIDSTLTASQGSVLSSVRGAGHSDTATGYFHYHFSSRAPLPPEWLRPNSAHRFHASGVERGSATWSGDAVDLRPVRTTGGIAIHARVETWSRSDERAVHIPFLRVVVAGHLPYPVAIRHSAAGLVRSATVALGEIQLTFKDYGEYTEMCAHGVTMPPDFSTLALNVLGDLLDLDLKWVYREQHLANQRVISVQSGVRERAAAEPLRESALNYTDFWTNFENGLRQAL